MSDDTRHNSVLPYRADPKGLSALIAARARGRWPEDRPALLGKALEGTTLAAVRLGFLAAADRSLTESGRRYAVGGAAERVSLLREALEGFGPYAELLRAVRQRGDATTTVEWVETWWGARGYGSSPSNRRDSAVVFGNIVEYLGLGRFVVGRRGRPSRIEWIPVAGGSGSSESPRPRGHEEPPAGGAESEGSGGGSSGAAEPAMPGSPATVPERSVAPGRPPGGAERAPVSARTVRLELRFEDAPPARLQLPAALPLADKRRLLAAISALVEER